MSVMKSSSKMHGVESFALSIELTEKEARDLLYHNVNLEYELASAEV